MIEYIILSYLTVISAASCAICICDKQASKRGEHRTRESLLLLLSALGGSVAMFATMQIIRHKTRHIKFIVGIPLIIMAQVAIAYVFCVLI